MIHIVNFPFCNYSSLERYFKDRKLTYCELDSKKIPSTDTIVIPGVGTFLQAMSFLNDSGYTDVILSHARSKGKIIGICLGMQILLNASDESPGISGLGLIPGICRRMKSTPHFFVPHVGWNSLNFGKSDHPVFKPFANSACISVSDYYFVHSFHALPLIEDNVIARFSSLTLEYTAAVAFDNILGFQFHPEKSGPSGYALLDTALQL